jgi:hypothetical protein
MSSHDRRSAGRRRAWGRGPIILKFDPLERREVLSGVGQALPDLVSSSLVASSTADWSDPVTVTGQITNQGNAPVTQPFQVAVYASHNNKTGLYAVPLGQVTIPAGLSPGQTVPYTTTVRLPASPIPGVQTNGIVYIDTVVDPAKAIQEGNKRNNQGIGVGYDEAKVAIKVPQPANLINTAVGVYPSDAQWGGSLAITAQVKNNAQGDAPATRSQVMLTPLGDTPGGPSSVTLGSISVPAVVHGSTVNVEGNITLPATPPLALNGASQFILSILPDGDYLTSVTYPHGPISGLGIDQAAVNVTVPPGTTPPALGNLSDLAAGSVTTSSASLNWGQQFQAQALVENLGTADPGPFRVRFLLVGVSGDTSHGIFLGDTTLQGLAPGTSQQVSQNLTLPTRLPSSIVLSSVGYARVAVVLDPENTINETFKNNNISTSGTFTLRVLGTDGTSRVPSLPTPSLAPVTATKAKSTTAAPKTNLAGTKLHRKAPPPNHSLIHTLTVFPKRFNDFLKKYI